ncbi:histidine phosphatase family protein [Deinococcus petrolearius]|uniref:Histidine phosphatase family protein n=1 Tax=Deinococcus petrolearius TaxID=1751295 RepID=A0ABW1DEG0_9DEIO
MLPADLYLMRHGQTEWNVSGRSQGRLDSPLTALGVAQARRHARTLAGVAFTHAYTSPLGRARRTAALVLEGRDVPLTVLDDLTEMDHGGLGGLLPAERLARFPELAEQRRRDKFRTVLPGGESYATAAPRARRALEHVAAHSPVGPVLVVAHEMIGRLLRLHLLGLSPEEALSSGQPQDTVYRIHLGQLSTLDA